MLTSEVYAVYDEDLLELNLCHLIRHTPFYPRYGLHQKAECLTRVKVADGIACLRDNDNEVKILKNVKFNLLKPRITQGLRKHMWGHQCGNQICHFIYSFEFGHTEKMISKW